MVKRIYAVLAQRVGPVAISLQCADGIDREFDDMDQLVNYPNARDRQIIRLRISARGERSGHSAALSLSSGPSSPIDLFISASSDEFVLTLRQDLISLLRELRPWYSKIATIDLVGAVLLTALAGSAVLILGMATGLVSVTSSEPVDSTAVTRASAVFWAIIILTGAAVWSLNRLRSNVFPVAVFAIGEGMHRYQTLDTARWVIVVGFMVSIVASVVATLLL